MNSPEIIQKILHTWGFRRWHDLADRWPSSRVCLGVCVRQHPSHGREGTGAEPAAGPCCVLGPGWASGSSDASCETGTSRNKSQELAVLKEFHGENAGKGNKPYLSCLFYIPILHLSTMLKSIPLKSGVTGLSWEIMKVLSLIQCRHTSVCWASLRWIGFCSCNIQITFFLQQRNPN